MIFLKRKAYFNAAHRLHNPEKSDEWNKKVYGKCNNENWHGHNYTIIVTVAGRASEQTGFIIDFAALDRIIQENIVAKCDHKNLNLDVPFLSGILPSTENLVKIFFDQLKEPVEDASNDSGFLYAVKLMETERNSAVYCPYLFNEKL